VNGKKVLLSPLDPVHDIGLKMIKKGLDDAGHQTVLLQPDLTVEEILAEIERHNPDVVLLSRTLGYDVAETLARFADLADAAGIRERVKLGIGGMAIRPELATELGFDGGFGPGTTVEEALAFVENRPSLAAAQENQKQKPDLTQGYDYSYRDPEIGRLLDQISEQILTWVNGRTSPGVERARLREEVWDINAWFARQPQPDFISQYQELCGEGPASFYRTGELHPKTRRFTKEEVRGLERYLEDTKSRMSVINLRHTTSLPVVFNQYGTGCPYMDIGHIKASEAWGADGVVHFDPSWGARTEGFYDGFLTHQEDGTVITPANLNRIHAALEPSTLWQVRAHRGLNTPETVVLAGKIGADLTKINICYGSLGAGTDPERLMVDGYWAIRYAARYNLPFDVVTNEELCGVPAYKAFAGMLIVSHLGISLGARPILQPLFCYSPEVMVSGQMADNYIDFNAAKVMALRRIINAPIWPGAPIGFLTQSEERVQSAVSTTLHACLGASLGVDAVSIASTDEAYSGGPISAPSKIDTLRGVQEGLRFFGQAKIAPTAEAEKWADELTSKIRATLQTVADRGDFVQSLYEGLLGNREEGAYPGRAGRGTVTQI